MPTKARTLTLTALPCAMFVVCAMLAGPGNAANDTKNYGVPPTYKGNLKSLAEVNVRNAKIEVVLKGLEYPWAFEFIAPDEVLITEIGGRLSRFHLVDDEQPTPIRGLPEIATEHDQTGLLDVERHPDFARNGRIYFSYVESDEETGSYYLTAVATARLEGDRLVDLETILRAEPFGWSPSNFGGALEFDDRGHLYVTVGDRSEIKLAQRGHRLQGKLLRLNDDGSVPEDNPFVGDESVDDRIYALGLRNPQGLHFDHQSGRLIMAEHGPMGGDEINIIEPGANYGWPVITYGKNYTTEDIGVGTHKAGMKQPVFYYLPSEAISPLTMYRGGMFEEWDGHLLVGALKGKHVSKLDLDGDLVRSEYPILTEIRSRIRDVKVAADGSIFVLSQNGVLSRVYREGPAQVESEPVKGQQIYDLVCAGCHEAGADNAPKLEEGCRWRDIKRQPVEDIYRHAFEGLGAMPERGLCYICEDEHLKAAVDHMLDQAAACNRTE